jgi:hypothetical protein
MAFGRTEVEVIRRALRLAVKSDAPDPTGEDGSAAPVDFWLLDQAIAEAEAERERLRAFHLAELAHQRAALPGSAATFLTALENAIAAYAYTPTAEDLAALRSLAELPCGARERQRRDALLADCTRRAEEALDRRLTAQARHRETSGP